jgi:Kef-type K+ transport system membrane component KefB
MRLARGQPERPKHWDDSLYWSTSRGFLLERRDTVENNWLIASIWMALALSASLISIRVGLSVALAEILMGVIGGNFFSLHTTPWIDFLAAFGSVLLTFLAGAEIDPVSFRRHFKASLAMGAISFLLPFVGVGLFAYFALHWDLRAAQIAGIALSTTSVAVVYAVMTETRLNETELGKLILAACFVTDLGTVLALGILFADFNLWMVLFIGATFGCCPRWPLGSSPTGDNGSVNLRLNSSF